MTAVIAILLFFLAGATVFFSANSMALRTFSRARLHDTCKQLGKKGLSDRIVKDTNRLIWTCFLFRFICVINIFILIYETMDPYRTTKINYLLTATAALLVYIIFAHAIPHSLSKYISEKIVLRSYWILVFFSFISWPIVSIFDLKIYDTLTKRLIGVTESDPDQQQEEFLTDLQQHMIEGTVDSEEQEMIENVLELSDTIAEEIMTPRTDIVAVEVGCDLNMLIATINDAGHTRLPVYEENIDSLIGFVYAKDLLAEIESDHKSFNLRDKLRKPYFVPETKPLRALLHEFQDRKLHIAVVLDEYGGTAGIVTLEDILEELVGEITDEYEQIPQQSIKQTDDGTIELDARIYIDDLNDRFELDLPENEDYDTVGGFVFSYLGYIPKTGETFEYEDMKFTILSAEQRRIRHIRIEKIQDQ